MTWTLINLVIQIFAGTLGGNAAATIAPEHRFGTVGHTVVGAVGGFVSGYFLQTLAMTVVTASGSLNEPKLAEIIVTQILAGAAAGGMAVLVGLCAKHIVDHHKIEKS